jgi:hypothetical protein
MFKAHTQRRNIKPDKNKLEYTNKKDVPKTIFPTPLLNGIKKSHPIKHLKPI